MHIRRRAAIVAWFGSLGLIACSGGGGGGPGQTYGISGNVSGATVAGVTIALSGAGNATTTTDASGSYAFAGLPNGSYTVTPAMTGYAFSPASLDVTVSGADVPGRNFTAVRAYGISGTVSGATAAGVTVTLSGAGSGTATTDASGNYAFSGLIDGSYTVTPAKTGYAFSPASLDITVSGADVPGRNFTAIHTYRISGTVSGAAGVTMALSGAGNATTTTDGSGNYVFAGLLNGSYTVTPSLTGYAFSPSSLGVTVSGADVTGKNFAAARTYSISGNVSGAIAAGVTLTLSGAGNATTTTDGSGNYVFAGLLNGSYTVTPSLTGYAFSPASLGVTVSGADVTGRNFTAARTYSISGNVSGAIAAGVTVTLAGASSAATTTDGSGNYVFTGLLNGSYTVTPSLTGYAFSPANLAVAVNGADMSGTNFTAIRTYSISGTVSGATASGVTIALTGAASRSTATDANGNFMLSGLLNGSYTLTPSKGGGEYSFLPVSRGVTVNDADVPSQDFTAVDSEWGNWPVPAVSPATSTYVVDAAAGTVTDGATGLVWQRSIAASTYNWAGAKTYCRTLNLAGWSTGWRLPTLIEFESIVDYGTFNAATNSTAFPSTPTTYYWTSSPYAFDATEAWVVNVYSGGAGRAATVDGSLRVRCVR